jgi:cellulose synthase (UDP-forming)
LGYLESFFHFPPLNKIKVGKDIFGVDPALFYQVILYHRNSSNAAFCCGAGSIHRRKALESLILDNQKDLLDLDSSVEVDYSKVLNKSLYNKSENNCLGPFIHHISEDIYTSILLHSNKNNWRSYQHPLPQCKMLSPQTLAAYDKQFSRYAEGTFSIFFSLNNPMIKKGLSFFQRIAYAETIYSYFSAFWILVFLLSPIIFYFTLIPPLKAFSFDFFLRFIVLNILSQILSLFTYWGFSTSRSDQYFISNFWLKIRAFFKVLLGNKLEFNTTKKSNDFINLKQNIKLIVPHLTILVLTVLGASYNVFFNI